MWPAGEFVWFRHRFLTNPGEGRRQPSSSGRWTQGGQYCEHQPTPNPLSKLIEVPGQSSSVVTAHGNCLVQRLWQPQLGFRSARSMDSR